MSSFLETDDVTVFMSTGIGTVNLPLLTPLNNGPESEEGRLEREQWEKGEVKSEAMEREVLTSPQLCDMSERKKRWLQREALVIEKYKKELNEGSFTKVSDEMIEEVKDRTSKETVCNTRIPSSKKSEKKCVEAITSRKFDAVPMTESNEDIVKTSQRDENVGFLNKKTVCFGGIKDNPTESPVMSERGETKQSKCTHKGTNFIGKVYMAEGKDKTSVETSGIDIKEHSQSVDKIQIKDQRSMTDEKVNDNTNHLRIDIREQPLSKDNTRVEKEVGGSQQGLIFSAVPIVTILVGAVFFFYYGIPS